MGLILLIIVILLLVGGIGGLPAWGHQWGYTPSISMGTLLIIVLIILLLRG